MPVFGLVLLLINSELAVKEREKNSYHHITFSILHKTDLHIYKSQIELIKTKHLALIMVFNITLTWTSRLNNSEDVRNDNLNKLIY